MVETRIGFVGPVQEIDFVVGAKIRALTTRAAAWQEA